MNINITIQLDEEKTILLLLIVLTSLFLTKLG